jgi:FkbM family methyltransferase
MMKFLKGKLKACPWLYWRLKLWNHQKTTKHENELRLLPALARPELVSIDIGASGGIYSLALLPYSNSIVAFEPRIEGVCDLIEMTRVLHLPIQVETIALSNREGKAEMRILLRDLGRSTIAPENNLLDPDGSPTQSTWVAKKTLDSYRLSKVGFIKIDVEGHEKAVLEGAAKTIDSNRCNLLIEMEERHCQGVVQNVKELFESKGYVGFFADKNEIFSMEFFNPAIHQKPENIGGWKEKWRRKGKYINNFIFVPKEKKDEFLLKSRKFGFACTK